MSAAAEEEKRRQMEKNEESKEALLAFLDLKGVSEKVAKALVVYGCASMEQWLATLRDEAAVTKWFTKKVAGSVLPEVEAEMVSEEDARPRGTVTCE